MWNAHVVQGRTLEGTGHATFRLRVRLPEPGAYALHLRLTATTYLLFADDEIIAESGVVVESADRVVPASVTRVASFTAAREVTLTLQMANYHHARGGPRASVIFGTEGQIRSLRERQLFFFAFAVGCLAILVLYQFALYLLRRNDPL